MPRRPGRGRRLMMICHHAQWVIHPRKQMINFGWRRRDILTDGWYWVRKTVEDEERKRGECVRSITGLEASTMFRVRAASFLTGFAVASGIAMYQLQRDVWGSHHILSDEVTYYTSHPIPPSHSNCASVSEDVRVSGFDRFMDCFKEVGGYGEGTALFGG